MKQILSTILFCLIGTFTNLSAQQQRLLDNGWQFQRLETAAPTGEIRNQGSDWASQFNVEHVQSTPQQELAVPADTLRREFALLERGTWETVSLPHTPFVEPLVVLHQWQGICYYRRRFSLQPEEAGKRLWLDFEGAMHLADVWVNGQHLAQHSGGYTPFAVDVTDVVRTDRPNEVLVRLDNRNNPLSSRRASRWRRLTSATTAASTETCASWPNPPYTSPTPSWPVVRPEEASS